MKRKADQVDGTYLLASDETFVDETLDDVFDGHSD